MCLWAFSFWRGRRGTSAVFRWPLSFLLASALNGEITCTCEKTMIRVGRTSLGVPVSPTVGGLAGLKSSYYLVVIGIPVKSGRDLCYISMTGTTESLRPASYSTLCICSSGVASPMGSSGGVTVI